MKKILKNLLVAIGIIIYFMVLILAYTRMNIERLSKDIQVFAGTFLILGLLALEKAYKKDSGKIAIIGIELLVLAFHSVSIMHMVNLFKCEFKSYLLISSGIVAIYYVLKAIVIYTKDRKEYLKGLSDISEIVKEDEPIKKEAKKRSARKEENKKEVKEKVKENIESNIEKEKQEKTKKKIEQANKEVKTQKSSTARKSMPTKNTKSTGKNEVNKKTTTRTRKNTQTKSAQTKVNNTASQTTQTKKVEDNKEIKTEVAKKTTKSKKEVKEND